MSSKATIFNCIRRQYPQLRSVPYLDISETDDLRRKFQEGGVFPEQIRLPYDPMVIGFGNDSDGDPLDALAVAAYESEQFIEYQCFALTRFGNLGNLPKVQMSYRGGPKFRIERTDISGSDDVEHQPVNEFLLGLCGIVTTALMILHAARNIVLTDYYPKMSRQVRREKIRRGEVLTYKVLAIKTQGKPSLPLVTESMETLPLHWVRGNFAHYDSSALFGRYRGTFWRPAHIRGDRQQGFVQKDYVLR